MPSTAIRLHSAGADAAPITLAATLYLPETGSGPFPGLIVGHGAGSRRERHAEFCREAAAQGFTVLALDFRGHGESEGVADGPLEDDIAAAAGFLRKHCAVDRSRLCYRGSSMGGFYGLKAAAAGGLAAAVLLCPATPEVMLEELDESDSRWDIPRHRDYFRDQDSLTLASRVKCPILLVHARGDEVVPFERSQELARHLPGDTTLVALTGGSHTSAQHDPTVHRLTVRWLLDQVTSACTGRT